MVCVDLVAFVYVRRTKRPLRIHNQCQNKGCAVSHTCSKRTCQNRRCTVYPELPRSAAMHTTSVRTLLACMPFWGEIRRSLLGRLRKQNNEQQVARPCSEYIFSGAATIRRTLLAVGLFPCVIHHISLVWSFSATYICALAGCKIVSNKGNHGLVFDNPIYSGGSIFRSGKIYFTHTYILSLVWTTIGRQWIFQNYRWIIVRRQMYLCVCVCFIL